MENSIYDYLLMVIPLGVSIYTFSYALWLLKGKNIGGALGVIFLAIVAFSYPSYVLVFVH